MILLKEINRSREIEIDEESKENTTISKSLKKDIDFDEKSYDLKW